MSRPRSINQRAVTAFRKRRQLRTKEKKLLKDKALLLKRLEQIEDDLYLAGRTSRIVDGIALEADGADIRAIDEDVSPRWTKSYVNVHDGGTGLRFCEWREQGGYDEMAIITSQPEKDARKRALAWVLRGELPNEDKRLLVHHQYRQKAAL